LPAEFLNQYFPLLLILALGLVFAGLFMFLAFALGPKHPDPAKLSVYECGVPVTGDARQRFSVKFFIVAMIFLLFDVEVVFLFPWAVLLKLIYPHVSLFGHVGTGVNLRMEKRGSRLGEIGDCFGSEFPHNQDR
jgi:NADH-quinone oxidoreductase subunit A